MEDLLNLSFERFVPIIRQVLSPKQLALKLIQNYKSFQQAFNLSDHIEQLLLVAFTLIVSLIMLRLIYRLGRAIVSFVVECAAYLFILATILIAVQYRTELREFLEAYLNRLYTYLG